MLFDNLIITNGYHSITNNSFFSSRPQSPERGFSIYDFRFTIYDSIDDLRLMIDF